MAKSKITISDIQKALLSNTRFIKEPEAEEVTQSAKDSKERVSSGIVIDPLILKKYKILAKFMNIPTEELLNTALNHYLKLKSVQLEQAILKLTQE